MVENENYLLLRLLFGGSESALASANSKNVQDEVYNIYDLFPKNVR